MNLRNRICDGGDLFWGFCGLITASSGLNARRCRDHVALCVNPDAVFAAMGVIKRFKFVRADQIAGFILVGQMMIDGLSLPQLFNGGPFRCGAETGDEFIDRGKQVI